MLSAKAINNWFLLGGPFFSPFAAKVQSSPTATRRPSLLRRLPLIQRLRHCICCGVARSIIGGLFSKVANEVPLKERSPISTTS
jgi:hypothetical protein